MTFTGGTLNGVSRTGTDGVGYNGEVVPAASTLTVNVTTTAATPYSFVATHAATGLEYTATGYFASAGSYSVVLTHNAPTIAATMYGAIPMVVTGASNTLNVSNARIDLKSIPASETTVVDITHGSQTWMDRNLGARQAATDINDVLAHGNHYQWGRPSDGHEQHVWDGTNTAGGILLYVTTTTLATTDAPAHGNFIVASVAPNDWRDDNNNNRWAIANQGPCPSGYHVPTLTEWTTADTWNTAAEAFASPLNLILSGLVSPLNGSLGNQTLSGHYWSSSLTGAGTNARRFFFDSTTAEAVDFANPRGSGYSVRCIKD